jgi:hypothetical protein
MQAMNLVALIEAEFTKEVQEWQRQDRKPPPRRTSSEPVLFRAVALEASVSRSVRQA